MVKAFPNGQASISSMLRVNDLVYFTADDGIHGRELWVSDGTEAGTRVVKDIYSGETTSPEGDVTPNAAGPFWLTDVGGTLYFVATDGVHGIELWKSDGSEAGTVLVADMNAGPSDSSPTWLTEFGGKLYFAADDGVHGSELWTSDGTATGTTMVADIHQRSGSAPARLIGVNGVLLFLADDGSHGVELWRSDGTQTGTSLVADIHAGPTGSTIVGRPFFGRQMVSTQDKLYFRADDGFHGEEVWVSDGTTAGTRLLADVIPGPDGSSPESFSKLNNILLFTAPADGFRELFTIDLSTIVTPPGEFTGDGYINQDDLDALAAAVAAGTDDPVFDLNTDGVVDQEDRRVLVEESLRTWFGDTNLDGQFNAHDLVLVLQRGHYNNGSSGNLSWADGDWNGDGRFDVDDLTLALQSDGYLRGPRT